MTKIGEGKKKIFTIPEGEYLGVWNGYFCHLYKPLTNFIFDRIETKTGMKGNKKVKVIIEGTNATIYERHTAISTIN